jgi:RNA polymerase sigma-70 factor (ECF subfamily)
MSMTTSRTIGRFCRTRAGVTVIRRDAPGRMQSFPLRHVLEGVVATADRALDTNERQAFQQLVCAELPGLYSLARRLAGGEAEDLVQEALLRACRSFGSLRDHQAAPKWLRTILTNAWRDRLRKRGRQPREVSFDADVDGFSLFRTLIDEDPFPYSDSLHLDFLGLFGEDDVHVVLGRLPDRYSAPLVLRYVEGFATKQIARMLDLPLGTLLSQLHRGRKLLERGLWEYARESGRLVGAGRPAGPSRGAS